MNDPKISIITVSYNSADTIIDTFNSIRSQTYNNIEYIVVDGNSKDSTVNIIKSNNDIISSWVSEPDDGLFHAMNKGIGMATGEIVGILNSDDFYLDNSVVDAVAKEFSNNNVDSVYADLVYVNPDDTNKVERNWVSGKYSANKFLYGWMPPHPTFFVKRKFYESFGVFNCDFKVSADYELMLRFLFKYEISSSYINKTFTVMRNGGNSNNSMRARINANKEDRKAWIVNKLKPKLFTFILKPLRKTPQYLRRFFVKS